MVGHSSTFWIAYDLAPVQNLKTKWWITEEKVTWRKNPQEKAALNRNGMCFSPSWVHPCTCSLCAGMVGMAQLSLWLNSSFEITFSVLPDRLQCPGILTFSLLCYLLIRTLWVQGILLPSWSCEWQWGKHNFRGPVQTLPAHLITLTKGGQLWCSLTSNYEAGCGLLTELCRHLVAACQQWLY